MAVGSRWESRRLRFRISTNNSWDWLRVTMARTERRRSWAREKRRLLQHPRAPITVEAAFCPFVGVLDNKHDFWLGLVVRQHDGEVLSDMILDEPPSVEDIIGLLTTAMDRPCIDAPCRPEAVFWRQRPGWEELFSFLEEVGVETAVTEDFSCLDKTAEELMDWVRQQWQSYPSWPMPISKAKQLKPVSENLRRLRMLSHDFLFLHRYRKK